MKQFFTRNEALAALESLNIAAIFPESYRSKKLTHNLDIYFGPPEEFFIAPETQHIYTQGHLIPLLDDGNFDLVTFYDPATLGFVQYAVEAPNEPRAVLKSWQQYLGLLFIRISETVDDDEEAAKIAELIEFPYFTQTIAFLDSGDSGDWDSRLSEFIASLIE